MSTIVNNPSLFPALPKVMDGAIVSFCDDPTVLQMLRVCKTWNRNSELQKAKIAHEDRWGEEEGFPLKLLAIFRNCKFSIRSLPKLSFQAVKKEYGKHILFSDYVDFLNTRFLSAPIMRFNHNGRPGLVMCLQNRTNSEIGICTIFRRFSHKDEMHQYRSDPYKDNWVEANMQHNDRRVAPSQLSVDNFDSLIPVLSGTDPSVKLIDPSPAPIALSPPRLTNPTVLFFLKVFFFFMNWLHRLCGIRFQQI